MSEAPKLFYVFKKSYDAFLEHRGLIVSATTWQRAKGIAMNTSTFRGVSKHDVFVEPLSSTIEGVVASTDYVEKPFLGLKTE